MSEKQKPKEEVKENKDAPTDNELVNRQSSEIDKSKGQETKTNHSTMPVTISEPNPITANEESKEDVYAPPKPTRMKVVINADAYKTIILYSSRYANASIPRNEWKEIYGILVGIQNKDEVIVEKAIPMTFGHSTDVELGPEHYGFIGQIEDKLYAENEGRYVVGWFHSHPGLSLFYSWVDITNQISFQQGNPDFIGIVFDHTYLLDSKNAPPYKENPNPEQPNYVVNADNPNHPKNTGIVVYRINDPWMVQDNPMFDTNFHDVNYDISGVNQYFFANVLTELSSIASKGGPLQSAYSEKIVPRETSAPVLNKEQVIAQQHQIEDEAKLLADGVKTINMCDNQIKMEPVVSTRTVALQPIPTQLTSIPRVGSSAPEIKPELRPEVKPEESEKSKADKFSFKGKTAFLIGDSFSAIENYRTAIKIYQELGDHNKVVDILADVAEACLDKEHDNFAMEFSDELKIKAENIGDIFKMGTADYIKGIVLLHKGNKQEGLELLQNASVLYGKCEDYAGIGQVNQKISETYLKDLNFGSAALFTIEAIKGYRLAMKRFHPKRKSAWALPKNLEKTIVDLKSNVNSFLPKIPSDKIRDKIQVDLKNL